jgi:hypothetical protein
MYSYVVVVLSHYYYYRRVDCCRLCEKDYGLWSNLTRAHHYLTFKGWMDRNKT